jgi:sodium-dependent phosphate cotransporter
MSTSPTSKQTLTPDSQAIRFLLLVLVLVMFFTSLELMGESFKLMGGGLAETLLKMTSNPFVGLFIGILATSLVQSSSTTTTLTVSLVAAGVLDIAGAIPIVMGANIGTSVTNTIVSLGSVTRKEEFRRAMAGATVQDFFNFLAVAVLFPLELMFQVVSRPAAYFTESLANIGGTQLLSPVKQITEPIAGLVIAASGESGVIVMLAGLGLLFLSLKFLVSLLKSLVLGQSERVLHEYIFGHPVVSMLLGVALTFLVQSSSITTSLTVPLVGAGILTVTQIYPFVLGANIGTTMTAILAALVLSSSGAPGTAEALQGIAAVKVALAHLFFNLYGIAIFLPIERLRRIPIRLAEKLGDWAITNRAYAVGYIGVVFFVIPLVTILSTRNIEMSYDPPKPELLEQRVPASAPTSDIEAERLTPVKG